MLEQTASGKKIDAYLTQAGLRNVLAVGRGLSRRRPSLHPDLQAIASNLIELIDRLIAGEDPDVIRPMMAMQLRFWKERSAVLKNET